MRRKALRIAIAVLERAEPWPVGVTMCAICRESVALGSPQVWFERGVGYFHVACRIWGAPRLPRVP